MISDELLGILRCPSTGQTLALADESLLAQGNARLSGTAERSAGASQAPLPPLTAALVRADRQVLYPVRDGIPVLLVDEAITL